MLLDQYSAHIISAIESIRTNQREKILQAARAVYSVLAADGLIYVFGCGHSHILCEETFYRAGGLACVAPIFYPPLMLHEGALESSRLEKETGLAAKVLENYTLTQKDMLFCLSTSGINSVPIELTEAVRDQGVSTVATCSSAYFDQPTRCPIGKHLHQVADIWLDNRAPHGDAVLSPYGAPVKTTPLSTITGVFLRNAILAEGTELALRDGIDVPIYLSGNIPGGAQRNKSLIERFQSRIQHL